ncbi:MAG: DUF3800 domain-containing protein [Clostridiales bacterium]|nr:DUF3800 domain-containing protein [Clostridiales bacterium]
MKELSVFVDESGDFGEYDSRSPFYILSLVFHDQSVDINNDLIKLENEMCNIGWGDHCIHAGPIIRSENEYKDCSLVERQKIIMRLMTFTRKLDISFSSLYVEKKIDMDSLQLTAKLSKLLADFIRSNYEFFNGFDVVKIYYDNGQVEVTKILVSVLSILLNNAEFKRVIPAEYRLFQVADLLCTLKLTGLKMQKHILSKSEKYFFQDERTFHKNYIKPLLKKKL